jgi:hypothetical protein
MSNRAFPILFAILFLCKMAAAEPSKRIEQWEKALRLENALHDIASEAVENKNRRLRSESYEEAAEKIKNIFKLEKDPEVLQQVAHMALFGFGSTDDRLVDQYKEASFDICILLIENVGTTAALDVLVKFSQTERLDGGYGLTIDEAILRLKKKLGGEKSGNP